MQPDAVKLKNTEQLPDASTHVVESKVPVLEKLRSNCEKVTIPVGEEPLTVAVHFVHEAKAIVLGVQSTVVVVGARVASEGSANAAKKEGKVRETMTAITRETTNFFPVWDSKVADVRLDV